MPKFRNLLAGLAALFFGALALEINVSAQSKSGELSQNSSQVQQVIDRQINAFRVQDHQLAFSFAAPRLQKIFGSTDRFIDMVKSGYGPIYGARQWSFGRSSFENGAMLQEVLLTGPNGRDWVALYTLKQQEDGSWRITGVQMKKANALST